MGDIEGIDIIAIAIGAHQSEVIFHYQVPGRQDVDQEMKKRGSSCQCIRCREIRKGKIDDRNLVLDDQVYKAGWAEEHFLSYNTQDDNILGFLRLSLPSANHFFPVEELQDAAIIREVHVYGQSVELGGESSGSVQHRGLGSSLIEKAAEIALSNGYRKLTVISAVGTREYYAARGFTLTDLYMVRDLRTEEN